MTDDELQQIFGPLYQLLPLHEGCLSSAHARLIDPSVAMCLHCQVSSVYLFLRSGYSVVREVTAGSHH